MLPQLAAPLTVALPALLPRPPPALQVGLEWNIPPAISSEGDFIVVGDQGMFWIWQWSEAEAGYTKFGPVTVPPLNQEYWLPVDIAITTVNGSHYAGVTWFSDSSPAELRFTAYSVEDAVADPVDVIPIIDDVILKEDIALGTAIVREDAGYFFVGTIGGDTDGSAPTVLVYNIAAPKAVWSFAQPVGDVQDISGVVASSTAAADVIHLAWGGYGQTGGDGNGGEAYWVELTVPK